MTSLSSDLHRRDDSMDGHSFIGLLNVQKHEQGGAGDVGWLVGCSLFRTSRARPLSEDLN